MKKFLAFAVTLMVAATLSQAAHAADFSKQIKARKAVMQLYAFNVGQLAAMVKGKCPMTRQRRVSPPTTCWPRQI